MIFKHLDPFSQLTLVNSLPSNELEIEYRRPGLSSRCSPCLELSAAARHVCTVSFHLPKPSEDTPLQPLLSSCQAREVISSLRPFLNLNLNLNGVANLICRTEPQQKRLMKKTKNKKTEMLRRNGPVIKPWSQS